MRRVTALLGAALLLLALDRVHAQDADLSSYEMLLGSWEGELEYLDYRDDSTTVRLATRLEARLAADGSAIEFGYTYREPDGSEVTGNDRFYPTEDGIFFGSSWRIEEETRTDSGAIRLVLVRVGQDNDRDAVIRTVVATAEDRLTITKYVQYRGAAERLKRNQYRFRRATETE